MKVYVVLIDKDKLSAFCAGVFSTYEAATEAINITVGPCQINQFGDNAAALQDDKMVARIIGHELDEMRWALIAKAALLRSGAKPAKGEA